MVPWPQTPVDTAPWGISCRALSVAGQGKGPKIGVFLIVFLGIKETFGVKKGRNCKKNSRYSDHELCIAQKVEESGEILCQGLKGCYIAVVPGGGKRDYVFHPTNTASGTVPRDGVHAVLVSEA